MLHNEHLSKADELYEVRHDEKGNVIHVFIKDGEAHPRNPIYSLNQIHSRKYANQNSQRLGL